MPAEEFLRRQFPQGGNVLCAVSGGLDSMCLLHWMTVQKNFSVAAAHFNHQLRGEYAQRDEQFVKDYCAAYGIPFVSGRGDTRALAATGMTVEEAARHLRYAFLEKAAEGYDAVFTAHHADDQAETMLLNLLRGTGSAGLAGIPQVRGKICRPFLEVPREKLTAYAEACGIPHMEDETNHSDVAARNVLRHRVFPVLKELNPRAVENMTRTARLLCMESNEIERLAGVVAAKTVETPKGISLAAEELNTAEAVMQRAVLRMMAQVAGHRKDLTAKHVDAVLGLQPGQSVMLPYGMMAYRTAKALMIEHVEPPQAEQSIRLGESASFGDWKVTIQRCEDGNCSLPDDAELQLTHWKREDGMALPGTQGRRSLKRLCAEHGISSVVRDSLPVLRVNGILAAVPLIGIEASFAKGIFSIPVQIKFDKIKNDRGELS